MFKRYVRARVNDRVREVEVDLSVISANLTRLDGQVRTSLKGHDLGSLKTLSDCLANGSGDNPTYQDLEASFNEARRIRRTLLRDVYIQRASFGFQYIVGGIYEDKDPKNEEDARLLTQDLMWVGLTQILGEQAEDVFLIKSSCHYYDTDVEVNSLDDLGVDARDPHQLRFVDPTNLKRRGVFVKYYEMRERNNGHLWLYKKGRFAQSKLGRIWISGQDEGLRYGVIAFLISLGLVGWLISFNC